MASAMLSISRLTINTEIRKGPRLWLKYNVSDMAGSEKVASQRQSDKIAPTLRYYLQSSFKPQRFRKTTVFSTTQQILFLKK